MRVVHSTALIGAGTAGVEVGAWRDSKRSMGGAEAEHGGDRRGTAANRSGRPTRSAKAENDTSVETENEAAAGGRER